MEAKENLSSVLIWKQRSARSADFQSAVSPNCIRQGAENPEARLFLSRCGLKIRDTAD
jgi:hypothetical protein